MDSRLRGNDDSKVIPAKAGIHTALTEGERLVAGTGVEIPYVKAGAGSLTVAGLRGNDGCCRNRGHVDGIIPAFAGMTDLAPVMSFPRKRMSASVVENGAPNFESTR